MKPTQDRKYGLNTEGQLCNIATGVPIPSDEPIFILRAKDITAEQTLHYYMTLTVTEDHKKAIQQRIQDFKDFRVNSPDRMKAPDTVFPFPEVEEVAPH